MSRGPERGTAGFSLIELMIVVVIIAILAAIAMNSYRKYILRSHRTEATRALQELASREESYYFGNNAYTSVLNDLGANSAMAGGYYTVAIASASSTDYTVKATAQGTQAQDVACVAFSLDRTGVQAATGSGDGSTCWQGR